MGILRAFSIGLVLCGSLWAMPSVDRFFAMSEPDGDSIKVRTVGDEVYRFQVTEDGYVVARDSLGFFSYVNENGTVSGVRAHDVSSRSEGELEFLSTLSKDAVRKLVESKRTARTYGTHHRVESSSQDTSNVPAMRLMPAIDSLVNSGEKKALVILVQFSDVKFSSADPKAQFESYLNEEGYSVNGNMGSVRDYFNDNSNGKFIPNFDVVGPVTLSKTAYKGYGMHSSYGAAGGAVALIEALDTLKAQKTVDFTQYDNDGDGTLDFVQMIYAGVGSNDTKQDSAIWPHMWYLAGAKANDYGVHVASSGTAFRKTYTSVNAYACSNELDGPAWTSDNSSTQIVGVGTFIHEFSHLLGLGDHYSSESGLYTLSYWDVMDLGAYNYSKVGAAISSAPPYYSAFEREFMGWMKTPEITESSTELTPVQNDVAFKVTNPKNADEFFMLEYRNRSKWDVGLTNHGMLIWHIDYNDSVWKNAVINNSTEMHVDIVEADGVADAYTTSADVFPGTSRTKKYTSFNGFVTWAGDSLGVHVSNIAEASDYSKVTFSVKFGSDYEEPVTSSSSIEEIASSSSAEVAVASSSSDAVLVSSSSEVVLESSSSETVEAFSSSSETPGEISIRPEISFAGLSVTRSHGILTFSGIPQNVKVLRVFSLNGNLLYSRRVTGSSMSLDVYRSFGKIPVIVMMDSFVVSRF